MHQIDASLFLKLLLAYTVGVVGVLFLCWFVGKSTRLVICVLAIWLFTIVAIEISSIIGHSFRQHECMKNRAKACNLISAINTFYQSTGRFPCGLHELLGPIDVEIVTGGSSTISQIEYIYHMTRSPRLSYRDGWYTYTYDFGNNRWERDD